MTTSRGILGPRRRWTEYEDAVLRAHYATTLTADLAELLGHSLSSTHQRARGLGLVKSREWIAETARLRIEANPEHGSRHTRIQPGTTPPNKGIKHPPGWAPGRMAESQFKPGRPAQEARNYLPIGSLRLSKDGYLERKITDDPAFVPARRWVAVHRLVWMEANGPVPDGHVVVFRPGRRTTVEEEIALDSVELVTRQALMARNTVHNLPPALASIAQLRGALSRQISKRAKESI